jgi:hypothetical protein
LGGGGEKGFLFGYHSSAVRPSYVGNIKSNILKS